MKVKSYTQKNPLPNRLFLSTTNRIILIVFVFLSAVSLNAQVIFSEPFNEANNAITGTDNTGGVTWTTSCPTCTTGDYFNVQSNALECDDTNGPATWTTGNINVSSCVNGYVISVDINLAAGTNGFEECTAGCGCNCVDWISLEYNANGAGFVPLSSAQGGTCTQACSGGTYILLGALTSGTAFTYTACLPPANTLVLRIALQTWAQGEIFRIDNVNVSCNTSACILPIELISFDAREVDNKVELDWVTATEHNNNYFTIERSLDAISFEEIDIVKAAGNSLNTIHYKEYDINPLPNDVVYYRLKQTDFDLNYSYSEIKAVEHKSHDREFKVYPNPSANGIFNITAKRYRTESVLVEVIDFTGKKISENLLNNSSGFIDLSLNKKGLYILKIITNDKTEIFKVINN